MFYRKYSKGRFSSRQLSARYSPSEKELSSEKGKTDSDSTSKGDYKAVDLYHSYHDPDQSVQRIFGTARSDDEGYLVPESKKGVSKKDAGEYHSYNYPDAGSVVSKSSDKDRGRYTRGPDTSHVRSAERKRSAHTPDSNISHISGTEQTDEEGYLVPEGKSGISQKGGTDYHFYNYPDARALETQSTKKDRGRYTRGPDNSHLQSLERRRSMRDDASDSSGGSTHAYEKNIIHTSPEYFE